MPPEWKTNVVDKYKNRPDGVDFDDTSITLCLKVLFLSAKTNIPSTALLEGHGVCDVSTKSVCLCSVPTPSFGGGRKLDKKEKQKDMTCPSCSCSFVLEHDGFESSGLFSGKGLALLSDGDVLTIKQVVGAIRAKFEVNLENDLMSLHRL